MAKSKKDLDKLEKDILVAQEKLANINSAINRDQLLAENKAKDIVVLWKEEISILDDIELHKEKLKATKVAIDKAGEKNKANLSKLNDEKCELQSEVDDLRVSQSVELKSLVEIKKENEFETQKMAVELSTFLKEISEAKEKAQKELEDFDNKIIKKESEINTKIDKRNEIASQIETNKKDLDWQNLVLSDLLQKTNKSNNLDANIESNKKLLDKLASDIEAVKKEKIAKDNEKNKLESELIGLREEKWAIVKAKLAIADREIQLNSKENYIKEKFTAAGLSY